MRLALSLAAMAALAACATQPPPAKAPAAPTRPTPEQPPLTLRPTSFSELPGWAGGDHGPALTALKASCAAITRRADSDKLGRQALYGGTIAEWRLACAAAASAADPKAFFETYFQPHEVVAPPSAMRRLTGYYEPIVEVRTGPEPGFTEPFLARPDDLVAIDMMRFNEDLALSKDIAEDALAALPKTFNGDREAVRGAVEAALEKRFRRPFFGALNGDKRVGPAPSRAALDLNAGALAYARPCDVYDVQVQGSARVRFPDGRDMRVAYAAQNGWAWKSIYGQLRAQGAISSASKKSVCDWMGQAPASAVRDALNLDPSYVFFALEPITDPSLGPKGAQGVPLTPLGSIAVDPGAHPYGAVLFVDGGESPVGRRLLVAQDTGGAIRRGPLRGDVFFGTGPQALALAQSQNAEARIWTLLPIQFAPPVASAGPSGPAG